MLSSPHLVLALCPALIALAAGQENNVTANQENTAIYCYDCNSGASARDRNSPAYNQHCDTDGTINQEIHVPIECQTFCFARVDKAPAGVVFRGCSDGLYLRDSERHVGCFLQADSGSYMCLCQEDTCNTHDLTAISLDFTSVTDTPPAP